MKLRARYNWEKQKWIINPTISIQTVDQLREIQKQNVIKEIENNHKKIIEDQKRNIDKWLW